MLKRSSRSSETTIGPAGRALLERPDMEMLPFASLEREAESLPRGSTATVTCSPAKGIDHTLDWAGRLVDAGLVAVPHLAAHMVTSEDHLARIVEWLAKYQVQRVYVIGGDASDDGGPYHDAAALIRGLIEAKAPVTTIGIGGYPDGHTTIPAEALAKALLEKQALLDEAGLKGWIATQMCFDTKAIVNWATATRAAGVHLPINLGIPGVVDPMKLLTIGMKVGVGQSIKYLRKNASAMSKMATGGYDPGKLLGPLEDHFVPLGITGLHVFTFNQATATEEWRRRVLSAV